jgi:hypothetical protein
LLGDLHSCASTLNVVDFCAMRSKPGGPRRGTRLGAQHERAPPQAAGPTLPNCATNSSRILYERHTQIGRRVAHGFWKGRGARSAPLCRLFGSCPGQVRERLMLTRAVALLSFENG